MLALKNTFKILLVLTGLLLVYVKPVFAQQNMQQSLQNIDFSKVQVDNLSDQQISEIITKAHARGLSDSDIINMATARGMSPSEASKLQTRIQQVESKTGTVVSDTTNQNLFKPQKSINSLLQSARADTFLTKKIQYRTMQDSLAANGDVFGYSLFNTKNLTFAPSINIPTPKDYVLGSGDEIVINVWGVAQMTYQETISPDGTIQINGLGPIYLSGLTIDQARQRIIKRMSEIYSGLSPDNPQKRNTFADVTLGQIRSINVTILGDVRAPGTYSIPSLSTVFNALYVSGGPDVNGSFRSIEVIRNNKVIDTLDVYDFLMNGTTKKNIHLNDQDIVKVNPYKVRVYIHGQIKRPLIYEVKPNESLSDVIHFAGGFLDSAYTRQIKVYRRTSTEQEIVVVDSAGYSSFKLKNGDNISVGALLGKFQNLVKIEGAVWRPGNFEFTDSSTVYSLIKQAGGLRGRAYMSRALLYRKQENEKYKIIPFDLSRVISDPAGYNIKLQKDDIVSISSIFDMEQKLTVNIRGEVQIPGTYPYLDDMTLSDLIMEAKGFNESAAPSHIQVSRIITQTGQKFNENQLARVYNFSTDRNLQLNSKDKGFKLKPFDRVYVFKEPNYSLQQYVAVSGQVLYPGDYTITSKTETISDLIKRAGGFTPQAYPQGATLVRKNKTGLPGQIGIDLPKIIAHPGSKYDLMVMNGDSLSIPKRLQTVRVQGSVMNATSIRYDPHFSLHDYIDMAGGFTDSAATRRVYVVYPDGSTDHIRHFLFFRKHPTIKPGTRIIVPKKAIGKMSPQERMSIISAIVSISATVLTSIAIAARYL